MASHRTATSRTRTDPGNTSSLPLRKTSIWTRTLTRSWAQASRPHTIKGMDFRRPVSAALRRAVHDRPSTERSTFPPQLHQYLSSQTDRRHRRLPFHETTHLAIPPQISSGAAIPRKPSAVYLRPLPPASLQQPRIMVRAAASLVETHPCRTIPRIRTSRRNFNVNNTKLKDSHCRRMEIMLCESLPLIQTISFLLLRHIHPRHMLPNACELKSIQPHHQFECLLLADYRQCPITFKSLLPALATSVLKALPSRHSIARHNSIPECHNYGLDRCCVASYPAAQVVSVRCRS